MKYLLIILLSFSVNANTSQADENCNFSALDYEIKIEIKDDTSSECLTMNVSIDDETNNFTCDEIQIGKMTEDEISEDESIQWILKKVGMSPKRVEALNFFKVSLDDDGGSIIYLKASLKNTPEIKTAGVLTYMGGASGSQCKRN